MLFFSKKNQEVVGAIRAPFCSSLRTPMSLFTYVVYTSIAHSISLIFSEMFTHILCLSQTFAYNVCPCTLTPKKSVFKTICQIENAWKLNISFTDMLKHKSIQFPVGVNCRYRRTPQTFRIYKAVQVSISSTLNAQIFCTKRRFGSFSLVKCT